MESLTDFLNSILNSSEGIAGVGGFFGTIAVAYLGGVLSSLTPCIYPMIPITVSVIGGTQTEKKLSGVSIRIAVYIGGMAVVYSVLGVLAGLTGKIFGSFTNTPHWYFILGIILTVCALWMLDVLKFDPSSWFSGIGNAQNANHKKETTLASAFFLGATSGFIAAPCTTPVLTAVLAYIANSQSVGMGLILMFFFALGLGTILILIASFTSAIKILPKSGNWMNTVKRISGYMLLAFGNYLFYRSGMLGGL